MNCNFNVSVSRTWSKGVPSNGEMPQPTCPQECSGFYNSPTATVDSSGQNVVDFWNTFFLIQQGLDDQDFAQVTHATETCVTTPCTASMVVPSPLPRKKSSIGTTNFKHFQTKYFSILLNLKASNRIPIFKYHCFSISDFNPWASLRFSCSLYKWNSRESLKKAVASKTHWANSIKLGRTKTGIEGVLGLG